MLYSVIEKEKDSEDVRELLTLQKDWLKELNEEVAQIHKQNKKLLQRTQRTDVCKNMNIISKLAPSLFTQYHVYFDDIFDALMDDILTEEVIYFL